jgi:hypothetical protein
MIFYYELHFDGLDKGRKRVVTEPSSQKLPLIAGKLEPKEGYFCIKETKTGEVFYVDKNAFSWEYLK